MGSIEYETSIIYDYYWHTCNNIHNFDSYMTQLKEVVKLAPMNILEIGCGNKLFSTHMKNLGVRVVTLDINKNLEPDVIADISKNDKLYNEINHIFGFDCVCAFEVLEHIPKEKLNTALTNICNLSKKYVVISLPFRQKSINFLTSMKHMRSFGFWLPFKHKIGKSHYWEVDFDNLNSIISLLGTYFKKIEYKFPIYNKRHIFFIMEKR